ncbi:hypothetical protein KAU32_05000, partial [bacterium]|nr:hypothetical protein [bacterium]
YFRDDRDDQNIKIMTGKNKCKDFMRVQIPIGTGEVELEDISSDGKVAYVLKNEKSEHHLHIVNRNNEIVFYKNLGYGKSFSFVRFSNKGDKILYYLKGGDGIHIFTFSAAEDFIIPNSEDLFPIQFDWNFNDSKIVFGFSENRNDILMYDLENKELKCIYEGRELTGRFKNKNTSIRRPIFFNDSEILFFDRDNSFIWKLNFETGEKLLFYNGKKTRSCLVTYYDTELSGIKDITTDGKYLICSRWRAFHWGLETINIVLIDIETKKRYSLYTYAAGLKYFTIR